MDYSVAAVLHVKIFSHLPL